MMKKKVDLRPPRNGILTMMRRTLNQIDPSMPRLVSDFSSEDSSSEDGVDSIEEEVVVGTSNNSLAFKIA